MILQTPASIIIDEENYESTISTWNADVHLLSTYCFLSKDEAQIFASKEQVYLIKDVFRYNFENVTGTKRIKLTSSSGMVSNWMFFLQRNDVNFRNEWSNYTNWPYENPPLDIAAPQQIYPDLKLNWKIKVMHMVQVVNLMAEILVFLFLVNIVSKIKNIFYTQWNFIKWRI